VGFREGSILFVEVVADPRPQLVVAERVVVDPSRVAVVVVVAVAVAAVVPMSLVADMIVPSCQPVVEVEVEVAVDPNRIAEEEFAPNYRFVVGVVELRNSHKILSLDPSELNNWGNWT
jgi:hypothetical protein